MAHWAEIDDNNIVLRVTVGSNDYLDEGYQWLIENLGGRWIKTSYNTIAGKHLLGGTPLRGNYAGIGYFYDQELDAFIPPKPFASWVLNVNKYTWEAPTPMPDDGYLYYWNEENQFWAQIILNQD